MKKYRLVGPERCWMILDDIESMLSHCEDVVLFRPKLVSSPFFFAELVGDFRMCRT